MSGVVQERRPLRSAATSVTAVGADHAGGCQPSFRDLVREDLAIHDGDWTRPGFRALFAYRFGRRCARLPPLLRGPARLLYRLMQRHVRNAYGIELHDTATVGRRFRIGHQGGIVIHPYAVIGDDCTVRQGVMLGSVGPSSASSAPTIGRGVEIGAGAKLLGRILVGDFTKIGPNAVILIDLPAGCTAVVEPARVLPAAASRIRTAAR